MMDTATRTTLGRLVVATLLLAASVAGCAPTAPTSNNPVQPTQTPAASATPASKPTTGSAASGVDAAGGAVTTSLTVGSASKATPSSGIARPTDKAATDAAIRTLRADDQIGKVRSIAVRSMTQDKKGKWWVLVAIKDDMAGSNQAVLTYDGKTWEYVVFGEGVSNDDLPPDVRF